MARKRMIDPGIWSSEQFGSLCREARLLFVGIFSNADDAGRLKGAGRFLKATIFPYDEDITSARVIEWRDEIASAVDADGVAPIRVYAVNGIEYIDLPRWSRWQRIDKPSPSILPPFPDQSTTDPLPFPDQSTTVRSEEKEIVEEKEIDRENLATDAIAPSEPTQERVKPTPERGKPRRNPTPGPNPALVIDAFRAMGLSPPPLIGPEAKCAQALLSYYTPDQIACCYQAYASHEWGTQFDWDKLSLHHLAADNRIGNWLRDKSKPRGGNSGRTGNGNPEQRGYSQRNHI